MPAEPLYVKWSGLRNPHYREHITKDRKIVKISIHPILAKDKTRPEPMVQIVSNATVEEMV